MAFFDMVPRDHLGGDIDGMDEDGVDLAVAITQGLVDVVEPGIDRLAAGATIEPSQRFVAVIGFAGSVSLVHEVIEGLTGEFGEAFEEGFAHEVFRALAAGDADIHIVDEGPAMLGSTENSHGGGRLGEGESQLATLEVGFTVGKGGVILERCGVQP